MSRSKRWAVVAFALAASLWAANSSWLHGATGKPPLLLAHRGLAQTFPIAELQGSEDTSKIIYPPEHAYIENAIASMEGAFEYGADIVELDVQRTADGHFAVFHDALLEFRTDGKGPVRAHSLQALKTLDVGFGYSADGGETFPLRGKGVGLMPSLDEVLDRFPDREFLIDIKTGGAEDGEASWSSRAMGAGRKVLIRGIACWPSRRLCRAHLDQSNRSNWPGAEAPPREWRPARPCHATMRPLNEPASANAGRYRQDDCAAASGCAAACKHDNP